MSDAEERQGLWCPLLESLIESQRVMREKLKKTAHDYKAVMQACLGFVLFLVQSL
jgi:hypothetical protein